MSNFKLTNRPVLPGQQPRSDEIFLPPIRLVQSKYIALHINKANKITNPDRARAMLLQFSGHLLAWLQQQKPPEATVAEIEQHCFENLLTHRQVSYLIQALLDQQVLCHRKVLNYDGRFLTRLAPAPAWAK
jgi:hypothetical protein